MRGIFRGLNITITREIPAFGLYFGTYEAMTRREDATQPLGTFHMLMAGGFAGVFSWLFTYPIDFVKSRLQVVLSSNFEEIFPSLQHIGRWSNDSIFQLVNIRWMGCRVTEPTVVLAIALRKPITMKV